MAMTADQVVVRLRAETAQYQQNMRNAAVAATQFDMKASTAIGNLGNAFTGLGQGAVKMSADVSRSLDRMASSQGPARLERQIDGLIKKQLEFGRMTAVRPQNLPGLGGASWGVSGSADPFKPVVVSAEKATKAVGNMQFSTANIAAQFNDIGVTAAMGMNPMLIALQQGTQLSQAFAGQKTGDVVKGLGAAFGAMVSPVSLVTIGLVAVTAAVAQWAIGAIAAGRDTKSLEESLKSLRAAIGDLREAQQSLGRGPGADMKALAEKYGAVTSEVIKLVDAQRQLAVLDANSALIEATKRVDDFTKSWIDLGTASEGTYMARIRREIKGTAEETRQLYSLIREAQSAQGPEAIADAYGRIREILVQIVDRQGGANKEAVEFLRNVVQTEDQAMMLVSALNLAPAALDNATSSAAGLTNELLRAVNAAQQLANAGVSDLRRAQIELDFRNDPVGRATALARERFDAATEVPSGAPPEVIAAIEQRRRAYVAEQTEAAKLLLTRDQLNEADREAERLAKKKPKKEAASPQQRAIERFDDRILKEIEALNAEAEALARLPLGYDEYGNAVAAARKEAEMLQDLQNKGVTITPQLAEQVGNLALDWYEVADAAAEARERHQEFQQNLEQIRSTGESAFSGLITGAHSFSDALSNVLRKLADMAASSAFDSIWQMGLGMLRPDKLSGALRGAGLAPSFAGGGYTGHGSRTGGIDGHGGFPAILHPNETVIDHTRGQQVGGGVSFAPNISIAPGVTQEELAMTFAQARQEYERNFLPMLRKNMPGFNERYS